MSVPVYSVRIVGMLLPKVSTINVPLPTALSRYHLDEPPTVACTGSPLSVVELKLLISCEPSVPADTDGKALKSLCPLNPTGPNTASNKSSSLSYEWPCTEIGRAHV